VLTLLCSAVLAQVTQPFNYNVKDLKYIWESPRLQPAVNNITAHHGINKNANERIIGGSFASLGQFPFHVLTIIDGQWWCGGSIINQYWVLTAAHCVYQSSNAEIYSILNINDGYFWATTSIRLIVHPLYDDYQITNDIGLIELAAAAPNNAYTSYITLPYDYVGNNFVGYTGIVQGFGIYSNDIGEISTAKRYVDQTVITAAACAIWQPFPTELCTDTTSGTGACSGDSGGALFIGDVNIHDPGRVIIGIVSFGASAGCAIGYPDVYTRVTEYLPWIDQYIH